MEKYLRTGILDFNYGEQPNAEGLSDLRLPGSRQSWRPRSIPWQQWSCGSAPLLVPASRRCLYGGSDRCGFSLPARKTETHASLMSLRLPCILTIVMRTCPVAPLVMGHPTAVSGAMQLLSPHLACLFEWDLGSGER